MTETDNRPDFYKAEVQSLVTTLKNRFEKNMHRHKGVVWDSVLEKLQTKPEKLLPLKQMEETGGEPDVVDWIDDKGKFAFADCSKESPKGRRSVCYDLEGLHSRKDHPPMNSAVEMAIGMGIELLTEEQYRYLQQYGPFDTKTSSWLLTPLDIREKGGALFGDYRYGKVFVYHNGAQSYYAVRGFRGMLRV